MEKLRVALVGCGGICNNAHIPAIKSCEELTIVAICDINPDKFAGTVRNIGHDVKTYTDYKEMIVTEKPDIVHVLTPNYLHSPISVFGLENGCHVICEKPDAINVDAVLAMQEAEKKSGKKLMVIRNNRYNPAAQYVKRMVEKGEFGDVYTGRCGWIRRRGIPGKGGWFTTKAQSGGGPLIDLGVHMLDLAIYLMGNPKATAVSGCTYNKFADSTDGSDSVHSKFGEAKADGVFDVEDLAIGYVRFENGASLQIEFSWASNIKREKHFVELRGSKAGCNWINPINVQIFEGDPNKESFMTKLRKNRVPLLKVKKDYQFGLLFSHKANVRHFVDVITKGVKPIYTIDQGVNMIKILTGMYESARRGEEVKL